MHGQAQHEPAGGAGLNAHGAGVLAGGAHVRLGQEGHVVGHLALGARRQHAPARQAVGGRLPLAQRGAALLPAAAGVGRVREERLQGHKLGEPAALLGRPREDVGHGRRRRGRRRPRGRADRRAAAGARRRCHVCRLFFRPWFLLGFVTGCFARGSIVDSGGEQTGAEREEQKRTQDCKEEAGQLGRAWPIFK